MIFPLFTAVLSIWRKAALLLIVKVPPVFTVTLPFTINVCPALKTTLAPLLMVTEQASKLAAEEKFPFSITSETFEGIPLLHERPFHVVEISPHSTMFIEIISFGNQPLSEFLISTLNEVVDAVLSEFI